MSLTKTEIIRAAGKKFMTAGKSFRMHHDGCPARSPSSGKDPEMVVTRSDGGFVWFCHRCHASGKIWDETLSPSETREKLDQLSLKPEDFKATENPSLPSDFRPINHSMVPDNALKWIWSAGISQKIAMVYGLGWSDKYQRVIIPVIDDGKLVGWVGREVKYEKKEERKAAGCAKYINRKPAGTDRMYFIAGRENLSKHTIILVEDVLSAIKIHEATGLPAMALLTTSFDDDLMNSLRAFRVYLWLDGNMLARSVNTVSRLRSLGLHAHHVHTPKDPKEYSYEEIFTQLESAYDRANRE